MKTLMKSLVLAAMVSGFSQAISSYDGYIANETGLAINTTFFLDLPATVIDGLSAEVTIGSAAMSNLTFGGGTASSFTITVISTQGVQAVRSTDTITILSDTMLSSATLTLSGAWIRNEIVLLNGGDWTSGPKSSNTAVSVCQRITRSSNTFGITASTGSGASVVSLVAITSGTEANNLSLVTNAYQMNVATAHFVGGQSPATLSVKGVDLTAGTTWQVGASTNATASNLSDKLNVLLAAYTTCYANYNVIFCTSTKVGVDTNYATATSSQSALMIPYISSSPATGVATGTMLGGTNSSYTVTSAVIHYPKHGYSTGFQVSYSSNSAYQLQPLWFGTTYYVIRVDDDNVALSTSAWMAVYGSSITFTSSSTRTTADTYTLYVTTTVGTTYASWQASNDSIYWVNFTSRTIMSGITIESMTIITTAYQVAGTTLGWDFGRVGWRYLRLIVTAPTRGAVWLKAKVHGWSNK